MVLPLQRTNPWAKRLNGSVGRAVALCIGVDLRVNLLDDSLGPSVCALPASKAVLEFVEVRAHLDMSSKVAERVEGLRAAKPPLLEEEGRRAWDHGCSGGGKEEGDVVGQVAISDLGEKTKTMRGNTRHVELLDSGPGIDAPPQHVLPLLQLCALYIRGMDGQCVHLKRLQPCEDGNGSVRDRHLLQLLKLNPRDDHAASRELVMENNGRTGLESVGVLLRELALNSRLSDRCEQVT